LAAWCTQRIQRHCLHPTAIDHSHKTAQCFKIDNIRREYNTVLAFFGNFAYEFLSVFDLVQPKGFGAVSKEFKNALVAMGFQFYETVGAI
jgi:hypothetical protein